MKRSLFFCMVALLCGVYTACLFPSFCIKTFLFWTVLVLGLAACFIKRARVPFFVLLFFFAGHLQGGYQNDITNRPLYPYEDEYVTITADVIRAPELHEEDGSYSLTVRVLNLSFLGEEAEIGETTLLTIGAGNEVPALHQRFQAICRFYEPKDAMNTNGFDSARYYRSQNIFFRGKVENGSISVLGAAEKTLGDRFYALNQMAGEKLEKIFPKDSGAILKAMTLGDKSDLSDSLKDKLSVSGLSHMVSVSGMHMSILMMTLSSFLVLFGGNYRRRSVILLCVILFYMLFAGASPAVVRAAVCSALSIVAFFVRRKEDGLTSLGIAAGILILCNPLTAFDAGFMLSFAAALGITLLAEPACELLGLRVIEEEKPPVSERLRRKLLSYIVITVSAQIFLLPVSAYIFGYTSLWSFVAGLLALPLGTILTVGGLFVSLTGFASATLSVLCAGFIYPFVKLFLFIIEAFGSLTGGLLMIGAFSSFALFCYILFLALVKFSVHKMWRSAAAVSLSLVFLLSANAIYRAGQEELASVTFINVGQGDCALIRLPDGTDILIDSGGTPSYLGDYDVGEQIVLPYLRKAGVKNLDYVVATHGHEDHIRGLNSVLSQLPTEVVLMPQGFGATEEAKELLSYIKEETVPHRYLAAGDVIPFAKDVYLEVLMPTEEWLTMTDDENNRSFVLRFCFGKSRVLFMSDLEEAGEQYLAETTADGGADIIKAGHHGARTSTTDALLDLVNPRYVYIPCGENNFGHPAPEVLERCEERGIVVLRADEDKDVCFMLSKTGIRKIRKGGEGQ